MDMWGSGKVLLTDTYSHTANGSFWLNHEWLAEVIFYALYRTAGLPLLTIFCTALIAGGWTFTWLLTRGPVRLAFVVTVLALVSSAGWWEPRPHAFSLLFIPWMVFLLYSEKVYWLPVLFLVWANCHGGVLLGLALVLSGVAAQTLVAPTVWRRSLLVLLACAVAMTVTPLGIHFWTEIPRSLHRINQYTLDEWKAPGIGEFSLLPFWGIAAAYLFTLVRRRKALRELSAGEASLHGCAAVLLVAALAAVRSVGPFLMVAVPALTHLWARGEAGDSISRSRIRKDQPVANLAIIAVTTCAVIATLSVAYRNQWRSLKWNPVPHEAIVSLERCPGNLYNRYDEGGLLLWFAPGRPVFLDGRQDPFPAPLVLEHIEMETGVRDYKATFDRYSIGCAFLPLSSPVARRLLDDKWTTVYRSAEWIVLRSEKATGAP
jgi:hypothetical protein